MLVARHRRGASGTVGEREQYPLYLLGLFGFERDDLVVDLHGASGSR